MRGGGAALARSCWHFGDQVTVQGTLTRRHVEIEEPVDIPELRLSRPACVARAGVMAPFQPTVTVLMLEPSEGSDFAPPPQAFGRPLEVTGTLREPVSKFDVEPGILTLTRGAH